jgi:TetR/AcrR family transcriptional regulator, cholesterol catabolism regulator
MDVSNTASLKGIRSEVAALKRERTIAAAVELFYERGFENTTLEAVGDRLGVTKPFIYAHFNSKVELLAEICSRGIASALEAMDSVLPLDRTPTEKLRLLGRRFAASVMQNQMHIAIFTREEKNLAPEDFKRISKMRREFDQKLRVLLSEGAEAGEFQFADAGLAALSIGGMVSWAYIWYRSNGRLSIDELADIMANMILAMVQAQPGERPATRAKPAKAARPSRRK